MNIKEKDKQYIAGTYGRAELEVAYGKGSLIYDTEGREYIDLGSGIGVNIFGMSDEEWLHAVTEQAAKVQHSSNLYYTEPQVKLAQMLCERTGMSKVFFGNSGAEANECAIKAARKYSDDKYGSGRSTVVTLKNSFHGRTLTTLSATGQDSFHTHFAPFTPGFVHVQAGDIEELKAVTAAGGVCAVMIEMVQGEGGVNVLDKSYVTELAQTAKQHDILLIVDEVQTGNGRCGKLYAYMDYGIKPDIVTTAKGLGGGLPIGAVLFNEKTAGVYTPGTHGSTFGGNPVCTAGALNILSRIDDKLMTEVMAKSNYIKAELTDAAGVKGISGKGLMLGIATDKNAAEVARECLKRGVVVLTAKTKIRLLPALNIPMEQLEKAVKIMKEVLAE